MQCDRVATNFFPSVRDRGRQICTNTFGKNLPLVIREWNLKNTIFVVCSVYIKYEGDTIGSLSNGFGPLCKVMEYEVQLWLGLFLLELKRHKEKLLGNSTATQAHQQRTTTFFSPITHATQWARDRDITKGLQ